MLDVRYPTSKIPDPTSSRMPTVLLAYYCALILVASIIGGMIPVWFQLTHRWMQFAVSFVAGVMLGIGVLHMLPHALLDASAAAYSSMVHLPAGSEYLPEHTRLSRGWMVQADRVTVCKLA